MKGAGEVAVGNGWPGMSFCHCKQKKAKSKVIIQTKLLSHVSSTSRLQKCRVGPKLPFVQTRSFLHCPVTGGYFEQADDGLTYKCSQEVRSCEQYYFNKILA